MILAAVLAAVNLPACTLVAGAHILGGDLERAGLLKGVPAEAEIAFSPAPGTRRIITGSDLARIAARHGIEVTELGSGCFERETIPLTSDAVLPAIRKALHQAEAELTLVEISRFPVPRGEIVFRLEDLQRPDRAGAALWRGSVRYEPTKRFPVWARVRVTVELERLVAARDIAPGETLDAQSVEVVTRREFPGRPVSDKLAATDITGRRAKRRMARGSVINPGMLASDADVQKGQIVEVRVRQGAARLSLSGKAESDGGRGQIVSVRNPESGKLFRGRVEGRGLVVIGQ
jgi:flagella basal body P-ring formation protein FlgA